ncbi:MAG: autotransporter outer membrane beta-barrel domain-containing protein, partial [Pseudomonadota bacterium]
LDGVLGFGSLELDSQRYDAVGDVIATSNRDGSQTFASLAITYDWRRNGLYLWPYARIDINQSTLDSTDETGTGTLNLAYQEESYNSNRIAFGLLAEAPHATNFGWVTPRLRAEIQLDDESNRDADVSYAGVLGGQVFTIESEEADETKLLLGVGSDFHLRSGLTVSAEYNGLFSSGEENYQTFNLSLSSDLGGAASAPTIASLQRSGQPIQVEAGYSFADNINRSADSDSEESEQIFSTTVSTTNTYRLSENTRAKVRGSLGLEDASEHQGLDNISLGVRGDWQYRGSSQFGTPIYGLFGRIALDQYESDLRSGNRVAIGASLRKSFTDRFGLFTALEHQTRSADDEVFDIAGTGIRVVLNMNTGGGGTFFVGGELRQGDTVSSANGSGNLAQIADALVEDDAYYNQDYFAYRFDSESTIFTLGYNHALGPNDSFDISWRMIDTEATDSEAESSSTSYKSDRISLFYLMQF